MQGVACKFLQLSRQMIGEENGQREDICATRTYVTSDVAVRSQVTFKVRHVHMEPIQMFYGNGMQH